MIGSCGYDHTVLEKAQRPISKPFFQSNFIDASGIYSPLKPLQIPSMMNHKTSFLYPLVGLALTVAAPLSAQSTFDLSALNSANVSDPARYIVLSGSATTPSEGDAITIVQTDGITSSAQLSMSSSRNIETFTYGTSDGGLDVTREILVRGSGSSVKTLGISGNLTKYDSGTLSFRNHNNSDLHVNIDGNVDLYNGTMTFGTDSATYRGMGSLSVGGNTTVHNGALNFIQLSQGTLGNLTLAGGTMNMQMGSSLSTGLVTVQSNSILSAESGNISLQAGASLVVENNGLITPEDGTMILNGANTDSSILVMESGAHMSFVLGPDNASGKIEFWNYAGPSDMVLNNTVMDFSGAEEGTYTLFTFFSDDGTIVASSGIDSGLTVGSGLEDYSYEINYNDNSITLTVSAIPEARMSAPLGIVLILMLGWLHRRSSKSH